MKCRVWLYESVSPRRQFSRILARTWSLVPHRNCLVFSVRSVVPGVVESATKKSNVSFACESVVHAPSTERDYSVELPLLKPLRVLSDRNVALLQSSEKSASVVPDEWVERICEWSSIRPHLDVFASAKNNRFPRYWDKQLDAFCQIWSSLFAFVDPSAFSLLSKAVKNMSDEPRKH